MMKKYLMTLLVELALVSAVSAQTRPRLVVGIVVDQMRWDYLYRYYDRYGEGGFKRLLNEGYSCDNLHINYVPTVTAIGHSSIWTGSVPSIHGIAGNNFCINGQWAYCTGDTSVVGVDGVKPNPNIGRNGQHSPLNLLVTTVGDELKLATNFRSKVVGIALKDRTAILPAGHAADGAYWYDDNTGNFITSTFYRQSLPDWLIAFNREGRAKRYLSQDWTLLYPATTYVQSTADDAPYDGLFRGEQTTTFPHQLGELFKKNGFGLLRSTPFGATLTFDAAKAAIRGEALGQSPARCDLLALSISSTDYTGHQFGTHAVETEDSYLRLDRDLEGFFQTLDEQVGKGNYLVFLSADHGGAHNIAFLQDHKIPAEIWPWKEAAESLNDHLRQQFNTTTRIVQSFYNYQVFFFQDSIAAAGLDFEQIKAAALRYLKRQPEYAYVVDMETAAVASVPQLIRERLINGYHRPRSGSIFLVLHPGAYSGERQQKITGTTHSMWNPYDAHIPFILMGAHVPHGRTAVPYAITDIAPTLCNLLNIQMPNGCVGNPIIF